MTAAAGNGTPATAGLLDDIVVVEHGERIAAGACGMLLAQLGARVIAIEPPAESPNGPRNDAAELRPSGKWRSRASMIAGKESIAIDPLDETDRAVGDRLADESDVLLLSTDFPAVVPTLWERARRPGQIVCDITAFGHHGPLAGQPGSEAIVQAFGGIVDTTGRADRPPSIVRAPVLEMSAGVYAAAAIVAALRVRRLHGFGQRIDIALFDTAVNELVNFLTLHYAGQAATRSGNRHPLYTPWGSYRARDGFVLLCAVTVEQFTRVCQAIGRPELVGDPRFVDADARRRHHRAIDEVISAWSAARPVAECVDTMSALGVACGPIVHVDCLAEEPNLIRRKVIDRLLDPLTRREIAVPSSPIRGRPIGGLRASRVPAPDENRAAVLDLLASHATWGGRRVTDDVEQDKPPLAGVRVVEIGHYTVAPLASRQMGALGADVIKIEPPTGDAVRAGVPLRADGLAHIFALSNTDKRGLVLDLKRERDRARLDRLLAQSDVLVENLRPGALERFGFGSDELRRKHPDLIYCAISGFGSDSAYPGRPALDTVIQAMSGLMSLTEDDGEPVKAGVSASDMLGGQFGLLSVLAALEHRDRTGVATHFDISMHDTSAWMTHVEWPGNAAGIPATVVAAADGFIVVEGERAAIASLVSNGARYERRAALVARLVAAGLQASPVHTVKEVVEHPHTIARELLVTRPTSDHDMWVVLNCPLRLCATPPAVRKVMTRLGAEDAEVIGQFALDG